LPKVDPFYGRVPTNVMFKISKFLYEKKVSSTKYLDQGSLRRSIHNHLNRKEWDLNAYKGRKKYYGEEKQKILDGNEWEQSSSCTVEHENLDIDFNDSSPGMQLDDYSHNEWDEGVDN